MKKNLNLFILNNINSNQKLNNNLIKSKINLIRLLNIKNMYELKAFSFLYKSIFILNKLKKVTLIYNNNFITIVYNNKINKNIVFYKFNNINSSSVLKLYGMFKPTILINASINNIRFKHEHCKYIEIFFDCYHNKIQRNKIKYTISRLHYCILYNFL